MQSGYYKGEIRRLISHTSSAMPETGRDRFPDERFHKQQRISKAGICWIVKRENALYREKTVLSDKQDDDIQKGQTIQTKGLRDESLRPGFPPSC